MTAEGSGRTGRRRRSKSLPSRSDFGGLHVFDEVSFDPGAGRACWASSAPTAPARRRSSTSSAASCRRPPASVGSTARTSTGKPLPRRQPAWELIRSFQQTNTFRTATVRENISRAPFGFSGSGPAIGEASRMLIDEFELAPQLDEQSDKLPYGLQKMLGLIPGLRRPGRKCCCSTSRRPVSSGASACGSMPSCAMLRTELGCGVLIVEHDMDLVRRLCPRILVLDAGRVLAEGAARRGPGAARMSSTPISAPSGRGGCLMLAVERSRSPLWRHHGNQRRLDRRRRGRDGPADRRQWRRQVEPDQCHHRRWSRPRSGSVRFAGEDLGAVSCDWRARAGIGLFARRPPRVRDHIGRRQCPERRLLARRRGTSAKPAAWLLRHLSDPEGARRASRPDNCRADNSRSSRFARAMSSFPAAAAGRALSRARAGLDRADQRGDPPHAAARHHHSDDRADGPAGAEARDTRLRDARRRGYGGAAPSPKSATSRLAEEYL